MNEQEMRQAFIQMAEHTKQMKEIYQKRIEHLKAMNEHLSDMEVWSFGIGRRGLSQQEDQHMYQRLRFEHLVHQLYMDMERLGNINLNEIAIGTTLAASFITVMENISNHGFPMEESDAV